MIVIEVGFAALVAGMVPGAGVFWLLRRRQLRAERRLQRTEKDLAAKLQTQFEMQEERWAGELAALRTSLTFLESSAIDADKACRGLRRSERTQAMQLLRSGVSTESAASTLGIARSEMRLIARVSRVLTFQ